MLQPASRLTRLNEAINGARRVDDHGCRIMKETQILFVQGAGEGAHREDSALADSLRNSLGAGYDVHFPEMPDEGNAPYARWKEKIRQELAALHGNVVLVGHSVGASVLARCLPEIDTQAVAGIFLLSGPFWGGEGWRYEGHETLELPQDIESRFQKRVRIFLYHCRDDEIVPFEHLALYAQRLPRATVQAFDEGGHQFGNDLSAIAGDIRNLSVPDRRPGI